MAISANNINTEDDGVETIISSLMDAISMAHNLGDTQTEQELILVIKKVCQEQLNRSSSSNIQTLNVCNFMLKILSSDQETIHEFLEHV
ncbi:MAG: hypothetical protein AB8B83_01140 [Bdellovibrionales bacterium]